MTMRPETFANMAELTDYVNANGIPQSQIQAVFCDTSGRFLLVYWS